MPNLNNLSESPIAIDEQAAVQLLEQNLPQEILTQLQQISEQHGLTMAVLAVAILSILSINRGSAKYSEISSNNPPETNREIANEAAGQVLPGVAGMTVTAIAAANPLFAFPQVAATIGASIQYLSTLSESSANLVDKYRLRFLAQMQAIGIGVATTAFYAESPTDSLPVIGLTALSYAFANAKNKFYRHLTISGGTILVTGSGISLYESIDSNNTVGIIMSTAFLVLNLLFTAKEIQTAKKEGRVQELVDKVFDYLGKN